MFAIVKQILVLVLFIFVSATTFAQSTDSISPFSIAENPYAQTVSDSFKKQDKMPFFQDSSWISKLPNASKFDIEKLHIEEKSTWEFIWIIVFLIALTVLRTSFNRELQALFARFSDNSFSSINLNPSTFSETFFSAVLFIAFVINCSILTSISIQHFYPNVVLDTTQLLFLLTFLFTFFFATKTIVVRSLGYIFNERMASALYIDNLFTVAKTLAITTFPLVLFFYVAEKKFFILLFTLFIAMIFIAVLVLIWRWLSTSAELLYKSVYHFLLYVCLVEILVVFLFIKLLTKKAF